MTDNRLIHVLLVSGRDPVSDWLTSTLHTEAGVVFAGVASSLERAMAAVGQRRVDVMLLDTSVPDVKQLERLQAIAAVPMNPAMIVMVDPSDMMFVQQAMFAGARGFLLKPFTEVQLIQSLRQTFDMITQQRQALDVATAAAPPDDSAEILVVFSPKGGVGRTSLASSLAVALHQESRKRVTLVDGDLQFGDVDVAVNAVARKSMADLLSYVNELEPTLVESVLTDHSSGIQLLLAPPYFDPALEIGEGRLAHVTKTLAASQDGYVVVDAPSGLSESTLNILDVARRVLLVTAPSIASLRATKRFVELAAKLEYPDDKIVLVLSGYRKDADAPIEEIERHLGWPVAATLPSDPLAMGLALNQGQPIVCRDRNHAVSKAIFKLARYLHADPAAGALQAHRAKAEQGGGAANSRLVSNSMARLLRTKQVLSS